MVLLLLPSPPPAQIIIPCSTMKTSPPFSFGFFVIRSQQKPYLSAWWLSISSKCNRVNNSPTSEFYGGILATAKRSSWERGANLLPSQWCIHTWYNKSVLNGKI
jgi:hypothetical protein